jgi:hypothetical protein
LQYNKVTETEVLKNTTSAYLLFYEEENIINEKIEVENWNEEQSEKFYYG